MKRSVTQSPSAADDPLEKLGRECAFEFYRASGPGGQRRNKVETAVRVVHLPTGVRAQASERRSREQNRVEALRRLASALERRARRRAPRIPTRKPAEIKERELASKKRPAAKKRTRSKSPEEA